MLFRYFLMSLMLTFSLYSMETSLVNLETKYKDKIREIEYNIEQCKAYMNELEADYKQIMVLMNISQSKTLPWIEDADKMKLYESLNKIPADVYQKPLKTLIRMHKKLQSYHSALISKKNDLRFFMVKFNL